MLTLTGTVTELKRPILPMAELLPSLLRDELLANATSPVAMPVFFVLRGRKLSRFALATVPAADRDAAARELGLNSDAVAMLGGVAGHPDTWAIKVESVKDTGTVILALRDGELHSRRV